MRKCGVLFALLLAGLLTWFAHELRLRSEPEYHGRALSDWLAKISASVTPLSFTAAELKESQEAVQQIGTNAIPTLLAWLHTPEYPPWKYKIFSFCRQHPKLLLHPPMASELRSRGFLGLLILGPKAKSATPILTVDFVSANEIDKIPIARILSSIGPGAGEAAPVLSTYLRTHGTDKLGIRRTVAEALISVSPEADNSEISKYPSF